MFSQARWRLVAWNTSIVALLLLAIGGAVYGFFTNNLYKGVDQLLIERQQHLEAQISSTNLDASSQYTLNPQLHEPEYPAIVTDTAGRYEISTTCWSWANTFGPPCPAQTKTPFSLDGIRAAATKGQDFRTVTLNGEAERVLTFVAPPTQAYPKAELVQIAHPASGEQTSLAELRRLLLFGGMLGVLFAGACGLFLANKSLVPIREAFVRQRQFTADASHELRTPLALIRANAEMLGRSRTLHTEDGVLADEIIEETDHLNRLVSDLLTLARADTGALQIIAKPVDLRSVVADVHEDVRLIAQERGIKSGVSLNGAVVVAGDEGRLRQLLLILLDNAMKYTDSGGQVNVDLSRAENRARLIVEDTGIGIPKADLPHIFDRFYRVDRVREHESGGTGLGLSIAQWIVQAHHGSIRAEEAAGGGTKFQIDLPLAAGKSPAGEPDGA
jgi:signal transduction histidine kinase